MGSAAPSPVTVLDVFDTLGPPGTPLTTPEVAAEFDCTDRTIYNKLQTLVEDGPLKTKKVGANSRVWWRPPASVSNTSETERPFQTNDDGGVHPVYNAEMVGVIVWDSDFTITDANTAFLEMAGLEYEDALGMSWRELTPEEFYPKSERHIEQVEASDKGVPYEKQYYHKDGSRWWGLFESWRATDDTIIEYVVDITERKQREQQLRESEQKYRALFESIDEGFCIIEIIFDEDGETPLDYRIVEANPMFEEYTGLENAEGKTVNEMGVSLERFWYEKYGEVAHTGEPSRFEHHVQDWERWFTVYAFPFGDPKDDRVAILFNDITEQKAVEQKLREAKSQFEAATEAGAVGTWNWQIPEDRFTAGSAFAHKFGVDPDAARMGVSLDQLLSAIHEDDRDRIERQIQTAMDTCGEYEEEYRVRTATDEVRWVHARGHVECNDSGDPLRFPGALIDVTERKQRERLLEAQKELLEQIAAGTPLDECLSALCDAIPKLSQSVRASVMLADDERESFQQPIAPDLPASWSEGLEDAPVNDLMIGTCGEAVFRGECVTCEDVTTDERWSEKWRELCAANGVRAGHSEPILDTDEQPVGSLMLCFDEPRVPTEWEHRLADFGTYIAGIAIEREQSRQTLTEAKASLERLNTGSRELMNTDMQEIGDHAAALAAEVLDIGYAALWRYDETVGELSEYTSCTEPESPLDGSRFPDEFSDQVWQTFVSGDVTVTSELDATGNVSSEAPLRRCILVPMGRHGVLCVGSTRKGEFDDYEIDLAEAVAATVEAAWDRAEGEQQLADRNAELQRLDRLNSLIRDIDQALVEAESREAIDRAVCERLAASEEYVFAWIGERTPGTETISPREWAGVDHGYLETLSLPTDETPVDGNPIAAAAHTRELQVISDIATDPRAAAWREETLERGGRSCISIPLVYNESGYGVLTVYADHPQPDERDHAVLEELGETVAHAIDAVETKRTLLTDSVTELTLEFRETNDVLVALARDGDCDIAFDGVVPQQDGAARLFFTATDCDVDSMRSAGARLPGVADLALVQEDKTGCRFEMTVTEPTIASRIIDNGGLIRSFTVTERAATVVVDLPSITSVRKFVETIRDAYPKAALASRRTRDRPITTRGDLREALDERFTTRQREILETAYRSGFFESPRVQTGAELSELLEISQSTFSYHLREAERTLCELVFEDPQSSR